MRRVFIDTNLYLGFYKSHATALRKFLPSLVEIKDNIFVTRQIRDEVDRNKVSVTQQTLNPVREKVNSWKSSLPEILITKHGKSGPSWTKEDEAKILSALHDVLRDVARSSDPVSKGLQPIMAQARTETEEQLKEARLRREFGNPPGKKSDPLGDQLSWVQFVKEVRRDDKIWICTYDGDYYSSMAGKLYLNALLMRDLQEHSIRPDDVYVFDNISQALEHFSSSAEKVKSLPSAKVLEEATKEEKEAAPAPVTFYHGTIDDPRSLFVGGRFGSLADRPSLFKYEPLPSLFSEPGRFLVESAPRFVDVASVTRSRPQKKKDSHWPERAPKPPANITSAELRAQRKRKKKR